MRFRVTIHRDDRTFESSWFVTPDEGYYGAVNAAFVRHFGSVSREGCTYEVERLDCDRPAVIPPPPRPRKTGICRNNHDPAQILQKRAASGRMMTVCRACRSLAGAASGRARSAA